MNELNKTTADSNNPLIKQAQIADAMLDKQEKESAEKEADKYHYKLQMEEVIDGGGRTKESRLAEIIASYKSI